MLDYIINKGLVILNTGETTFRNQIGESAIDLTVASPEIAAKVVEWTPKFDTSSDHATIIIRIRTETNAVGERHTRRVWRKADWTEYKNVLTTMAAGGMPWTQPMGKQAIDDEVAKVTHMMNQAADKAIPVVNNTIKGHPWWTKDLTLARKIVQGAKRDLQRATNKQGHALYKAIYNKVKKVYETKIKRAKRSGWRKFVESMEESGPWGLPYKIAKGMRSASMAEVAIPSNGQYPRTIIESNYNLLSTLFPRDDETTDTPPQANMRSAMRLPPGTEMHQTWDEIDLKIAVGNQNPKGATGHDGVAAKMVTNALPVIGSRLLDIYNACLTEGYFPVQWKIAEVRCFQKKGPRNAQLPNSYRPICLLSVLGKTLETLIAGVIDPVLDAYISQRQFGGTRGRSTVDAITRLISDAQEAETKYVIAIFFDISGAFDNAWWPQILGSLQEAGVPSDIFCLCSSFLENREARITSKEGAASIRVNKGTPQGSTNGGRMWKAGFNDVLKIMENMNVPAVAFVDDLEAIACGNSRAEVIARAEEIIRAVDEWTTRVKLKLNQEKTQAVVLRGNFDERHPPRVRTNSGNLKFVDAVLYLGVKIGKNLIVSPHVDLLSEKVATATRILNQLASATWGINYKPRKQIYHAVFEGIVTYAAGAWVPLIKKGEMQKILQLQRNCLIQVTQAYRTVSYEAIQIVADVTPIDLKLYGIAAVYRTSKGLPMTNGPEEISRAARAQNDRKTQVDNAILAIWEDRWRATVNGENTKKFFPTVKSRKDAKWVIPDHWMAQMLTGHGNFAGKLHFFRRRGSPLCPRCGAETEDPEHIVLRCVSMDAARRQLYQGVCNYGPSLRELVENEEAYKHLKTFVSAWRSL